MAYNAIGSPDKFAIVAELMDEDIDDLTPREGAKQAAVAVTSLMEDLEMPETLSDLDIPEDGLEELADMAMNLGRVLDNNPRIITRDDALFIYEEAF